MRATRRRFHVDADLFATELDTHRRYLLRVAQLQLRDADLAEDVVQETLVAALSARAGFSGRSSLRTWLTGILKHKIVDAIRQRQRQPIAMASFEEETDLRTSIRCSGTTARGRRRPPTGAIPRTRCRAASSWTYGGLPRAIAREHRARFRDARDHGARK